MVIGLTISLTRHAFAVDSWKCFRDNDFLRTPIQHIMVQIRSNIELRCMRTANETGTTWFGSKYYTTPRKIETASACLLVWRGKQRGKFGRITQKFPLCDRWTVLVRVWISNLWSKKVASSRGRKPCLNSRRSKVLLVLFYSSSPHKVFCSLRTCELASISLHVQKRSQDVCQIVDAANNSESQGYIL
jgi:hypothetical protein